MGQNPEENVCEVQPEVHYDPDDLIEVDPNQYLEVHDIVNNID